MDEREYRAHPAINWSLLKSMRVSAKQFQHDATHPREPSSAMMLGLAIHALALEGVRALNERFAVWEGRRDPRTKAYQAFLEDAGDRTVLSVDEMRRVEAAAAALRAHPCAARHLESATATEHVVLWKDDDTGLDCKARVDLAGPRLIELKSTGDVVPRRFAATAARLGYHVQAAFYEDGLRATGHEITESPVLITVQQDAPHDVVVYAIPPDVIDQGRRIYKRLLSDLRECVEADEWPGLADGELTFNLPAWAYDEDETDEPVFTMGGVRMAI